MIDCTGSMPRCQGKAAAGRTEDKTTLIWFTRASSAMEKETVAEIALMFGWKEHLGHLTSSGTFANLEALWIAGNLHPKKKIAASEMAHYTHQRPERNVLSTFITLRRLCLLTALLTGHRKAQVNEQTAP